MENSYLYLYNIFTKLNNAYKHMENTEFSVGELAVIHTIEDSEDKALHITQICERTDIARPSVTPILRGLEERGFIRRIIDQQDGRRYLVAMTESFYEIMDNDERRRKKLFKEFIESMNQDEIAVFLKLVERMESSVEKYIE